MIFLYIVSLFMRKVVMKTEVKETKKDERD